MDPSAHAAYAALSLDVCCALRSTLDDVIREKEALLAPPTATIPGDFRNQIDASLAAEAASSVSNSSQAQMASAVEAFYSLPTPEGEP